jgi:hypothetical protein
MVESVTSATARAADITEINVVPVVAGAAPTGKACRAVVDVTLALNSATIAASDRRHTTVRRYVKKLRSWVQNPPRFFYIFILLTLRILTLTLRTLT